jgi:phage tail protein X
VRTSLAEEAVAGEIQIQFVPEIPAVSIEPIVPEERVSLLSRGMAVDAILDEEVNPASESSPALPDPQPEPEPTPAPVVFPTECEVRRGETVWSIAERMYGSADYVRLISYANGLSYSDPVIFAGQILALPDPSTSVPAPAPAPAASAPAVSSGSSTIISGFSDAEIDLYIRIVASECGAGWSYEGCLMVSQVIVNRMMSGRWGGLHGVLTAPNQFTPYGSDTKNRSHDWNPASGRARCAQRRNDIRAGCAVFLYRCRLCAQSLVPESARCRNLRKHLFLRTLMRMPANGGTVSCRSITPSLRNPRASRSRRFRGFLYRVCG